MIDQDFCTELEYIICEALELTPNEEAKGFWCDGVLMSEPDMYYTKKFVNDNRYLKLKGFIGEGGEFEYKVYLLLGPKALSRYARDLSIRECIPDTSETDWFYIDVHNMQVEMQLL